MRTSENPDRIFDVLIIGGGLAGTVLAHQLSQQSLSIGLIDLHSVYPRCFKAERYNDDSAVLFRKFGLEQAFLSVAQRISQVSNIYRGSIFDTVSIEMYGCYYHELVNRLRRELPENVTLQLGRVKAINQTEAMPLVTLNSGATVSAKLVVLACGASSALARSIGLTTRTMRTSRSLVMGFDVMPLGRPDFSFEALNFYCENPEMEVAILCFFKTHKGMRVNFTTYWETSDPRFEILKREPALMIRAIFPALDHFVGAFSVNSHLQIGQVPIYRTEYYPQRGVVLIGDAHQTVCPATGTGVAKILSDIEILTEYVPRWVSQETVPEGTFVEYYQDPRKVRSDTRAQEASDYLHRRGTSTGLLWKLERNPLWRNMKQHAKQVACSLHLLTPYTG